jgi:hypothetical protein
MTRPARFAADLWPWSLLLGRPRTVLALAPLETRALEARSGGRVTIGSAEGRVGDETGSFDLVLLDATNLPSDARADRIAQAASRVAPEGRLIVRDRGAVRELLSAAGLEVLAPEPRASDLTVARRAPRPGPLTLSIGMLTMDEAENIAWMMDAIARVAPDARVLCVDSSMRDDTPRIAERLGATVFRQVPPRGHGPAMERLMYAAAETSDALIYLDCDRTYPTEMVPRLRALLESGIDVVNTARVRERPIAMPFANYVANRTFAACARGLVGTAATDLHSGMRAYRASVLRSFAFDGEGDALPIDTLLWPARRGYRVVEVPIAYREREGVSKLRKVSGTVWTFLRLGRTLGIGTRRDARYEVWSS